MSEFNHDLEKIRLKKAEKLIKLRSKPNEIINLKNLKDYEEVIKNYNEILVLDFWAVWCSPCVTFAPIFEKVHQEYSNSGFIFAKVNVDENQAVARLFNITGIPTTLFIKKGKVIYKIVGTINYNNLKQILEKLKSYIK